METHVTGEAGHPTAPTSEILVGLNDLLQLDHDAIGAYDIAIERLQDRDHADQIAGFRLDHERHIRELNAAIAALGGAPKNEPHATGPFKQALQSLGGLAGDKGVLIAWRTNELQVRAKYDSYASQAMHWPQDVKRLVDRNALDEERHYRWVADTLQAMGVGAGENADLDPVDRKREEANTSTGTVEALRERAGELASGARDRVAGLADTVKERAGDVAGMAGSVRERVGDLAGSARERAGGLAGGARERVTGGLDAVANRISHLTGGGEGGEPTGPARYVRGGGLEELRGDFEEQVRSKPVQTLLVAAVAGFVLGRIIRR